MPEFVKLDPNAVFQPQEESAVAQLHPVDDGERKTLYDQLKEDREQKQLEFELKFQVQNATYKLDDKSAKFYADMHKEKAEKDALLKQQDQAEIERYRKLKNREPETKKEEPKKAITVKRKYQQPREPPLPKRTKPDPKNPLLDGYSSSDED